ncbi:hypothetical protein QDD76_004968 [Burkholderia cepacia]|jgi:hypothetical protein|uniref:Uncharacterized protein n=1 Tax=Burkholderia contaminans TaxID=488447 RepID=A0ABD7YFS7_9BURK|nr:MULTISPECIES: hypothetical protein [Burkholderia]EKS9798975.1 hypothetical protein [Burkholderia cepacia]EKS9805929.1 hypothetical protein [Burkholderia cepacia]EKS9813477.1 hypothetical protein [Burkholderia cepacia]EKS9820316.1 hypothetical protein [Burkholderia cepacia]EKS9828181.1 hypothetical protein [Burkholderia cepacia]
MTHHTNIDALRQQEQIALANVIDVQRKLARGSAAVGFHTLRDCKARLDEIQEELLLMGELPGLFLQRYFYLVDRATLSRLPSGSVVVSFPSIAAVAGFRDGTMDDRFVWDVERSLDLACAGVAGARMKTMSLQGTPTGSSVTGGKR